MLKMTAHIKIAIVKSGCLRRWNWKQFITKLVWVYHKNVLNFFTKSKWNIPQANINMAEKSVEIINEQNTSDESPKKLKKKNLISLWRLGEKITYFSAKTWNWTKFRKHFLQFWLSLDWFIRWTNCSNIWENAWWCKNDRRNSMTNIACANAKANPPRIS